MKYPSRILAAGMAALAFASVSFADMWTDVDEGSPLKFLQGTGGGSYYSDTFNILYDGYDPDTMQVDSARAYFAFADDSDSSLEYVDIFIDGELLINDIEVDGAHPRSNYAWYSMGLTGTMLTALQDGVLSYKVQLLDTSGYNDTYIKIAKLKVWGADKTVSVPDGGATAAMLGLGLAAVLALRRRFGRR